MGKVAVELDLNAMRAHWRAIRDRASAALAELGDDDIPIPSPPPSATRTAEPEPRWMKLGDYARTRSMSLRTLHNRIADGLPTVGEGHARRIPITEADTWLSKRS